STHTIDFNISGPGVQTIAPLSPLPTITNPVRIDGESQPGYSGTPLIELNGSQAGSGDGLLITAPNVTIRGLDINDFSQGPGIHLSGTGATDDWIDGNFLGTDPIGTLAAPNHYGVKIDGGATNNLVGTNGDGVNDASERNLLSANSVAGVWIQGPFLATEPGANANVIAGNKIGTDITGTPGLGNTVGGVFFQAFSGSAASNTIGGTTAGTANVISANGGFGIAFYNTVAKDNVVEGNLIGTDMTGTQALGNTAGGVGIKYGAPGNTI